MRDILKRKTRFSSFLVALIAGLSLLAVPASAKDSTPSADQIIEKYIQGGLDISTPPRKAKGEEA